MHEIIGRSSGFPAADETRSAGSGAAPLRAVPVTADEGTGRKTIRLPRSIEPCEVVAALLDNVAGSGDAVSAHLWLHDPSSDTLRLIHAEGPSQPHSTPVPVRGTILGAAITQGVAQIGTIRDARGADPRASLWRYALPLVAGETRGAAAIDFRSGGRPDLSQLKVVGGAMRGSLAGALALQVARTETRAVRALIDTSRDLARSFDADQVVATALERAIAMASAQTGSIMLLDENDALTIAASRGLPADVVTQTVVRQGEGIAGWVVATRQPVVVEDIAEPTRTSLRRHGVRSAVSVPVADDDGVLGVLNVGSRVFQARLSQSKLDALEALGRAAAVALRNARAVTAVRDVYFETLKTLAIALEMKDPYSNRATERVLDFSIAIGESMGLGAEDLEALRIAATLHDIGMAAAGDVVAVGNRQLSTVEWGMLKMHPLVAADIIERAPALAAAVPIVYHHHERYDGGGYVAGLAGDSIPLGARILAVADAYVAMRSDRPHRRAKSQAQSVAELADLAGAQFDPAVVKAFIGVLATGTGPEPHTSGT